jgi:PKD repeat protein
VIHHRRPRERSRPARRIAMAGALAVSGAAGLLIAAVPASASTVTTLTSPTTLSGSTDLSSLGVTATGAGVTATFDLDTSLQWSQAASVGTTFDANLVRQGRALNPSDSYSRTGSGSMSVTWTLSNLQVSWDGVGPLSLGSPSFSATGNCDLMAGGPPEVCHLASNQIGLLDPGFPAISPFVKLSLAADVTVTPQGIATVRQATFGGNPDGVSGLSLGESPITDALSIPCSVGSGDELLYSLGALSSTQGVSVASSLVFDVGAEAPDPIIPFQEDYVSFATPTIPLDVADSDITMAGSGATFDMGAVQHNNIPPSVDAGGSYSGSEGSPVTFDGSGSSSICGFPTLVWSFSDGGVAFGAQPQHTFTGPGTYSGLLTATDATGLTATTTFSVSVANLPPVADAGPNMSTEWGVPVTLNGSAVDPGTSEQPFLSYSWDFGDGSPSASGGAGVSHIYSTPGTYLATFTACDPEGACGTSTTQVVVTKRAATTTYTGPNTSRPSKTITLSATVVDDLGQPVAGRTVTFTLGTQTATATTSASGVASVMLKLSQKQGTYTVTASFAGDAKYIGDSNSRTFTIGS